MINKNKKENIENTDSRHRRRGGAFDTLASFLRNIKMISFGTGTVIQDRPGVTNASDVQNRNTFVNSKSVFEIYQQKEASKGFVNLLYIGRKGTGRSRYTNQVEISVNAKSSDIGELGNGQILLTVARDGVPYEKSGFILQDVNQQGLSSEGVLAGLNSEEEGWSQVAHFKTINGVTIAQGILVDKNGLSAIGPTFNYAVDTGSANTYVISLPNLSSYVEGMEITFKAKTANTGASTLNINGFGAKTIVKRASTALASGDIAAGMICKMIYDGTNFSYMNPIED